MCDGPFDHTHHSLLHIMQLNAWSCKSNCNAILLITQQNNTDIFSKTLLANQETYTHIFSYNYCLLKWCFGIHNYSTQPHTQNLTYKHSQKAQRLKIALPIRPNWVGVKLIFSVRMGFDPVPKCSGFIFKQDKASSPQTKSFQMLYSIIRIILMLPHRYLLVWPRNGHVLLPPTTRHICYIEAKHERERNQIDKSVAVNDDFLKQPTRYKKQRSVKLQNKHNFLQQSLFVT